jgi:conjugative relaxase-like TrwC/TraI family protein
MLTTLRKPKPTSTKEPHDTYRHDTTTTNHDLTNPANYSADICIRRMYGDGSGRDIGAGGKDVLSSAKIGRTSWRYYQASVAVGACEYYLGAGEQPGVWVGRGLAELGLEPDAEVSEQQLEAVFARGLHPVSGEALGRAWRADAVTGYDLTFSAPKSVSVLWAVGGATAQTHVAHAHRAAVLAALAYLDAHAAMSRRGTDGAEQIRSGGFAAALFDHRTSRAGDPQLHTHALVPNKLLCADGIWRTIDGHELFHHKKAAGVLYQAALRAELHSRLGVVFGTPSAHGQAEILGVPTEVMAAWSKRTAQIAAEAAPVIAEYEATLGRALTRNERAAVTKTAVLKTRDAKEPASSVSALHDRWRTEAAALGWGAEALHTAVIAATRTLAVGVTPVTQPFAVGVTAVTEPFAVDVTPSHSELAVLAAGRRRGVFSRVDVAIEIAAALPVVAETAEQVRARVEDLTDHGLRHPQAVRLGAPQVGVTPRASDARFTSREVLQVEAAVLRVAAVGQGKHVAQVPAVDPEMMAGLGPDQQAAVTKLTTGGDFVVVLTAPAGAGKTTTLGAASRVWHNAGYEVVGLAPSARAAAELAKATGGTAETLAKWLYQQARLSQLPAHEQSAWAPTARTVLVVDEASMASTFDLHTLTRIARHARAKIVLVGDPAQIGAINAPGGLITALAARGHGIELTDVHRFRHEWEAAASLRLRDGDRSVIDVYAAAGRLHSVPDPDQAATAVFAHWQRARSDGAEVMMLARTRDDVDQLNALAKIAAQAAGDSHGPQVLVGDKSFQAGDVIRTKRNNRSITLGETHVRNGDRYTILATTEAGGLLVDDLTERGSTMLPPAYVAQHVEHGWATTIDGAQGTTTDVAILLVRPGIDREHLYVGLTRGREENHAYLAPASDDDHAHPTTGDTDARHMLQAALASSGRNDAAHTLLDRANAAIRPALPVPSAPTIQTAESEEAARRRRMATQDAYDRQRKVATRGRGIGL